MCLLLFILYTQLFATPTSLRIYLQQFLTEQALPFPLSKLKKTSSMLHLLPNYDESEKAKKM